MTPAPVPSVAPKGHIICALAQHYCAAGAHHLCHRHNIIFPERKTQ